jgi:hypothetical protein
VSRPRSDASAVLVVKPEKIMAIAAMNSTQVVIIACILFETDQLVMPLLCLENLEKYWTTNLKFVRLTELGPLIGGTDKYNCRHYTCCNDSKKAHGIVELPLLILLGTLGCSSALAINEPKLF